MRERTQDIADCRSHRGQASNVDGDDLPCYCVRSVAVDVRDFDCEDVRM